MQPELAVHFSWSCIPTKLSHCREATFFPMHNAAHTASGDVPWSTACEPEPTSCVSRIRTPILVLWARQLKLWRRHPKPETCLSPVPPRPAPSWVWNTGPIPETNPLKMCHQLRAATPTHTHTHTHHAHKNTRTHTLACSTMISPTLQVHSPTLQGSLPHPARSIRLHLKPVYRNSVKVAGLAAAAVPVFKLNIPICFRFVQPETIDLTTSRPSESTWRQRQYAEWEPGAKAKGGGRGPHGLRHALRLCARQRAWCSCLSPCSALGVESTFYGRCLVACIMCCIHTISMCCVARCRALASRVASFGDSVDHL